MKTMCDEVSRILEDNRSFVAQTQAEQADAKAKLILEAEALHAKQQAIVAFVEGVAATVDGAEGAAGHGERHPMSGLSTS